MPRGIKFLNTALGIHYSWCLKDAWWEEVRSLKNIWNASKVYQIVKLRNIKNVFVSLV